jgi:hypothetical protein
MRYILISVVVLFYSLHATDHVNKKVPFSFYIKDIKKSSIALSIERDIASNRLTRENELLSDGFKLNTELGYAADKNSDDDALEYHLSIEKPIRFGDRDTYSNLLKLSATLQKQMYINRIKNHIYSLYIDACMIDEKIWLLEDAKSRNIKMTQLILAGVEGGEFDRSALLRSELSFDELTLRTDALNSKYAQIIKELNIYVLDDTLKPLCSDLESEVPRLSKDLLSHSVYYQQMQKEREVSHALTKYRDRVINEISLGVGYDDEMDLNRGVVFLQIPLTKGSSRENALESARLKELSLVSNQSYTKRYLQAKIAAFDIAQKNQRKALERINDILIPKAYETTTLIEERFKGSEASYLEYIDSQQTLFNLLLNGVDIRGNALKAEANILSELGIAPTIKD